MLFTKPQKPIINQLALKLEKYLQIHIMKNLIKVALVSVMIIGLESCTTNTNPTNSTSSYPNNRNNKVYRAPDGTVYRNSDIYRDRNGDVYQNGRILNRDSYPKEAKNLPPGQAKKVYGGEAKDYAPGQVKKRYGNENTYRKHNEKKMKKAKKYKNKK